MADIEKLALIMRVTELHEVLVTMMRNGWEDRTQAAADDYVCHHLEEYGCFSRDDVKKQYDQAARALGKDPEKMFEEMSMAKDR